MWVARVPGRLQDGAMQQVTLSLSLSVSIDPERDDATTLMVSLEQMIGMWCPVGATGYVSAFSVSEDERETL